MNDKMTGCKNYAELLEQLRTADSPKELRKLHKELRRYGDGIPFHSRYPNFSFGLSIVALIANIIVFALKIAL